MEKERTHSSAYQRPGHSYGNDRRYHQPGLKFGISERVVSSAIRSFVFIFKGCLLNEADVATHKELHVDIVQIVSRSVVRSGAP